MKLPVVSYLFQVKHRLVLKATAGFSIVCYSMVNDGDVKTITNHFTHQTPFNLVLLLKPLGCKELFKSELRRLIVN